MLGMDAIIGSIFGIGEKIIERVWPDPAQAAAAKLELLKMQQSGELARMVAETDLAKGQIEINKLDAASGDKFQSRWRPAVGWVGVIALALAFWPKAVVLTALWAWQAGKIVHSASDVAHVLMPPFPDLGVTDLIAMLGSILGVGAMRSFDKRTVISKSPVD